jgi:hypothetical protein
MPSDNPPSYESVIADFQARVDAYGPDLKPQQFLDAYNQLSPAQIDVLAANPQPVPTIPVEKHAAFTVSVAEAITSDEALVHLKATANEAALACTAVEAMFVGLTAKLASLDAQFEITNDPFQPRLTEIHDKVRGTIHESRSSAVKIALYISEFAELIVPRCNNETISIEKRREIIAEFIGEAKVFETEGAVFKKKFDDLITEFAAFTGTFTSWASAKGIELDKDIAKLNQEIIELTEKLKGLQTSLLIAGGVIAVGLPVLAAVMALSGPLAPFVGIAGLIAGGIAVATIATLVALSNSCRHEIESKQAEVRQLKEKKKGIENARAELVKLGEQDLKIFTANINVLSAVWQCVVVDAQLIQGKLTRAGKDAETPHWSKESLVKATEIYLGMAKYLELYAKGIDISRVPTAST